MTCIVGFVENGVTYLGGDSLGSDGYSGTTYKIRKVFHCKETTDVIIGYTTSFRMGQLLQYSKNLFDELTLFKNGVDYEYLVNTFVPNIQKLFSNGGFERNNSGEKTSGEFLLGYKGRLFKVQSDYSILESSNNYDACGCGEDFALGSLKTTEGLELSPINKIHKALQAASKFSVGVSAPFHIISTIDNEIIEFKD